MGAVGGITMLAPEYANRILEIPCDVIDSDKFAKLDDIIEEADDELGSEFSGYADKAWEGIHLLFNGGKFSETGGEYPLNAFIMNFDTDYSWATDGANAFLKTPEVVREIYEASKGITREWFEQEYKGLNAEDFDSSDDTEEIAYHWETFEQLRDYYGEAAKRGCHVIFSVSF
jgi:hypothetical protein